MTIGFFMVWRSSAMIAAVHKITSEKRSGL